MTLNTKPLKIGVLVSGNGSNLQALIDAAKNPESGFTIALVVSNVKSAFALERAQNHGIANLTIDHKRFNKRQDFETELCSIFAEAKIDMIVLAGFMRVLSPYFIAQYKNKIINIHPALCPSFPGMHAPQQALDRGVWFTGCTVHFVNEGVDEGPIIAQAVVPVLANDDAATLTKRIQKQEHILLAQVLQAISQGTQNTLSYKIIS